MIQGLKTKRRLHIVYQKFGCESGEKIVAPLALKLFHQRWYMLSHTGNHFATYSLDRMQEMELTDETFEVPEDFSPEDYFAEYFGVLPMISSMNSALITKVSRCWNLRISERKYAII